MYIWFQKVETRIINRLETHTRHHQEELAKAKREFREGFTSVHDSISNAKKVLEGKSKLLEDKLKKDINQVRKLVVLAWCFLWLNFVLAFYLYDFVRLPDLIFYPSLFIFISFQNYLFHIHFGFFFMLFFKKYIMVTSVYMYVYNNTYQYTCVETSFYGICNLKFNIDQMNTFVLGYFLGNSF